MVLKEGWSLARDSFTNKSEGKGVVLKEGWSLEKDSFTNKSEGTGFRESGFKSVLVLGKRFIYK